MSQMIEAGWKKADNTHETNTISDKELRHIFSLIDMDKNGYLGGKVSHHCTINVLIYVLCRKHARHVVLSKTDLVSQRWETNII